MQYVEGDGLLPEDADQAMSTTALVAALLLTGTLPFSIMGRMMGGYVHSPHQCGNCCPTLTHGCTICDDSEPPVSRTVLLTASVSFRHHDVYGWRHCGESCGHIQLRDRLL
jgi:hypothetical protein